MDSIKTDETTQFVMEWFRYRLSSSEQQRLLYQLNQLVRKENPLLDFKTSKNFDFVKILPRGITLKIFRLLDPKSLCRCSQVSSIWNYMSQDNELWFAKCKPLGWIPVGSSSPQCSWKLVFVKNITSLQNRPTHIHVSKINKPLLENLINNEDERRTINKYPHPPTVTSLLRSMHYDSVSKKIRESQKKSHQNYKQPWLSTSRFPNDIKRNNYLDNERIISPKSQNEPEKRKPKPNLISQTRPNSSQMHTSPLFYWNQSNHVESVKSKLPPWLSTQP